MRLSNRRQVRTAKKEVFGTITRRQVMSVSTIDAREQMSARACSSAPLSTRESFPDGRRHAFVCPSAIPRPRARQAAGSALWYRAAEGAVVAGPRIEGDAFCGRRSNRRGRRGPSSHVWTPPKNVFGAEELAAGDVGLGGKGTVSEATRLCPDAGTARVRGTCRTCEGYEQSGNRFEVIG